MQNSYKHLIDTTIELNMVSLKEISLFPSLQSSTLSGLHVEGSTITTNDSSPAHKRLKPDGETLATCTREGERVIK